MADVLDLQPLADHHTRHVLEHALARLGQLRHLTGGDPAIRLHLLTSLIRQAETQLTGAVVDAHDHGYSDTEILILLDLG